MEYDSPEEKIEDLESRVENLENELKNKTSFFQVFLFLVVFGLGIFLF